MSESSGVEGREFRLFVVRPIRPLDPLVAADDPELAKFMQNPALVEYAASGQWEMDAACRGKDAKEFFPEAPQGRTTEKYLKAVGAATAICDVVCTVRPECRIAAYLTKEQHGVWGGKPPIQRPETETARKHRSEKARQAKRDKAA